MSEPTQTQRYMAHLHRMQSAIRWTITKAIARPLSADLDGIVTDSHGASPKNLRVGVEGAMAANEALVNLLIAKGLIAHEEFFEEFIERTAARADQWEIEARDDAPPGVTFG